MATLPLPVPVAAALFFPLVNPLLFPPSLLSLPLFTLLVPFHPPPISVGPTFSLCCPLPGRRAAMSFLSRALRKAEVFLEQVDEQVVSASRVLGDTDADDGGGGGDGDGGLLSTSVSFDGDFPFASVASAASLPAGGT